MSELISYEEECQRAELLGLQPPDKAEFERKRSARLEQQLAEQEAAEAVVSVASGTSRSAQCTQGASITDAGAAG